MAPCSATVGLIVPTTSPSPVHPLFPLAAGAAAAEGVLSMFKPADDLVPPLALAVIQFQLAAQHCLHQGAVKQAMVSH
jgi:hypothetical protein